MEPYIGVALAALLGAATFVYNWHRNRRLDYSTVRRNDIADLTGMVNTLQAEAKLSAQKMLAAEKELEACVAGREKAMAEIAALKQDKADQREEIFRLMQRTLRLEDQMRNLSEEK